MGETGLPVFSARGVPWGLDWRRDAVIGAGAADVLPRAGIVLAGLPVRGRRANTGAAKALQEAVVRLRGPDRHGGHQDGRGDEQKLESGHGGLLPRRKEKKSIRLY
jgi:hypothetical protein